MHRRWMVVFPYGTADEVVSLCQASRDGALLRFSRVVVIWSHRRHGGMAYPIVLVAADVPLSRVCVESAFFDAGLSWFTQVSPLFSPIISTLRPLSSDSILYDSKEA